MLADVLDCVATRGVSVQNAVDQVLTLRREETRQLVLRAEDLFIKLISVLVLKRKESTNHGEENNTGAPNVGAQAVVSLALNHFGSGVARTPAGGLESLASTVHV